MPKLPLRAYEMWILRQEEGWSVFYIADQSGDRELYAKCTLEEAGAVCQEFWDSEDGTVTIASMPAHYRGQTA